MDYEEKQPVAWKDCCVEYWCEKDRNHINKWTGRHEMTEKLLEMGLNPNQSINQKYWIYIEVDCFHDTFSMC